MRAEGLQEGTAEKERGDQKPKHYILSGIFWLIMNQTLL